MHDIFVGRQPILDRDGELYGYELLHRRLGQDCAVIDDGDRISAEMLVNAVLEVGIAQLCGRHRGFINVTQQLLLQPGIEYLPSDQVVIEVLEDVPVDDELLARLQLLRDHRFSIALDDFCCLPSHNALLDYADIVKLDVLALDPLLLERQAVLLKKRGVKLLAEKVENQEMHRHLLDLDFDLFQGYFFARPETYRDQKLAPNNLVLLELLARVNEPDVTPTALEKILCRDVAMSVTIIRWANGSLNGIKHAVESIERAIVVVGRDRIRNWVTLLTLSRMNSGPTPLLNLLVVRARACELLASNAQRPDPAAYFLVGLLSALDVVLQTDMIHVLEKIPVSTAHKAALMEHSGEYGAALKAVIAMENGSLAVLSFCGMTFPIMNGCYLSAIGWADSMLSIGH